MFLLPPSAASDCCHALTKVSYDHCVAAAVCINIFTLTLRLVYILDVNTLQSFGA